MVKKDEEKKEESSYKESVGESKDLKEEVKEKVIESLKKALDSKNLSEDWTKEKIEKNIEYPPSADMGDFAFPCFPVAKELKNNPNDIALELRKEIGSPPKEFSEIMTSGPYINYYLDRKKFAEKLGTQIEKEKVGFGKNSLEKGKKIMVEFPSPNTNKPLHIGHLRNMALGESISRIKEFSNGNVIRANMNNDRGIHICKSMLAYRKYGQKKGNTPSKERRKPDRFVGDYYVLFEKKAKESEKKKEKLEKEAQEMLQKWEEGDKEVLKLWKKMNNWALNGFEKSYNKFGINPEVYYYESEIYDKGKSIVQDGLKKGIFKKNKDGAVVADLSEEGLGEKVVLRPDGTTVYITQDLYLAKKKFEDFGLDESINITADEQDYHFRALFILLDKLGLVSNEKMRHIGHGVVRLPGGKIKSREGTSGISADKIINKVQRLVKKELTSRANLEKKELEERSLKIALSAIKYFLLKVDIKKDMVFDPKEAISFEGDTGAYLQYTHARANSILKKYSDLNSSKEKTQKKQSFYRKKEELEKQENELIKKMADFNEIVKRSQKNSDPSEIANYVSELAKVFNEFYHSCYVIGSEREEFRIYLVKSTKQILKNCLWLLGIEALDEM